MDKIQKTYEYDQFKFREDNRHKILMNHVETLRESIQVRNLLEINPILVNEAWEIIDGQHRLMAARQLGVAIYYIKKDGLTPGDVITLNVQRGWLLEDYLNYYSLNGHVQYLKLAEFMKQFNLSITVALKLTSGKTRKALKEFREGKYEFNIMEAREDYETCLTTMSFIQKTFGTKRTWMNTTKFWSALLSVVRTKGFDEVKWLSNLRRMVNRMGARINEEDYYQDLMNIYNWHNKNKIKFEELDA